MKHKIGIAICIVLVVFTVGFIWNNSSKSNTVSHDDSEVVAEKIEQIVTDNGQKEPSDTLSAFLGAIRKAAHAIEFFILGIGLTALTFIIKKRFSPQLLWNILSSSLAIAVIDESIQIISGRGPKVKDILIDFCGAAAGFLLTLFIRFIISSLKKGKRNYVKN